MPDFQNSWVVLATVVLGLGMLTQCYYYLGVFSRLSFYKPSSSALQGDLQPVSVIISARNEYKNLEKNLKNILEQDYPEFEVIVVNDCSWDDSQKLLEYFQEQYPRLKVCQLVEQEKYPTGKKFALTIGIKAAQHEQLFFTDADCVPAGKDWLRSMQAGFKPGKEIVLGYSPYKAYPNLLNVFIRFESVFTAMAYFSAALGKQAFMGVGRNLAYTKSLFFRHKGFAGHQHIMSGDDDLHINRTATASNVAVQIDPESFVYTEPKRSFQDWQNQKTRHVSTGKYYKLKDQIFLGGYYASQLLFYVALIILFVIQDQWEWVLGVYLFRLIIQYVILYGVTKKLKALVLLWFIPLLDLMFLFYSYIFGIIGLFTKQRKIW